MKIINQQLSTNDLPVIIIPMEYVASINEVLSFGAGNRYETVDDQGVFHFLDHLSKFGGTKRRPTFEDLRKEMKRLGGKVLNVAIGAEIIEYLCQAHFSAGSAIHDWVSDIALHPEFDQSKFSKELEAIRRERDASIDNPSEYLENILWPKLLYGNQPTGWSGYGTDDSFGRITREGLFDCIQKLYVASNAILVVSGRVKNIKEELDEIQNFFGEIPNRKPSIQKVPTIERQKSPLVIVEKRDTEQTYLQVGVKTHPIGVTHPDWANLMVLTDILEDRIFDVLRSNIGIIYDCQTFTKLQSDAGELIVKIAVEHENAATGIQTILHEWKKLIKKKVPENEISLSKGSILKDIEIFFDDPMHTATSIAEEFILTGKVFDTETRVKEYNAVTPTNVQTLAQEIFTDERLSCAVVGPVKEGDKEKLYDILKF